MHNFTRITFSIRDKSCRRGASCMCTYVQPSAHIANHIFTEVGIWQANEIYNHWISPRLATSSDRCAKFKNNIITVSLVLHRACLFPVQYCLILVCNFQSNKRGVGLQKAGTWCFSWLLFICCTRSKHLKSSKECYLLGQDKSSKFWGNLLCQATKQHLNNS